MHCKSKSYFCCTNSNQFAINPAIHECYNEFKVTFPHVSHTSCEKSFFWILTGEATKQDVRIIGACKFQCGK